MADAENHTSRDGKEATRVRARKACKLCNSRRVRCNVMEKQPCSNCELASVPCELVASRRGKYIRRPGIHGAGSSSSTKRRNTMDSSAPHPAVGVGQSNSPIEHPHYAFTPRRASESMTGPSPLSVPTSRSMTSLQTATPDADNTVFLGESNLLTCVASSGNPDPRSPSATAPTPGGSSVDIQKPALCYPITQEISARASRIAAGASSKAATIDFITSQGAFTFPVPSVCDAILRSYFAYFHPCFPILLRSETSASYAASSLSPLLFQALLFVGSSYCPIRAIQEMGFVDRHAAKRMFYEKAKLLYDAEWEGNKTVVVLSLFLMSFWRAGPENQRDTRFWLGAAISLAQTRGFHRFTRSATMDPKHMKLRRRIWWSLYVRDRQCNASLGLPSHIRDEDCDVPMLDHNDFADEGPCLMRDIFGSTMPEHEAYAIHMAGLTILLGKVVNTEFAPSPSPSIDAHRSSLKDQLLSWKAGLPIEMCSTGVDEPASFWSNMLLLAYNHIHILLHRSTFITSTASKLSKSATQDKHPSLHAATTISRIIEDMLSQNTLQYSQIHLITSLFSALCIHVTFLRSSAHGSCNRKLAEQRAQVCILGLRELQKSWDVNNWVLQLFFSFLDERTANKLHVSDFQVQSSTSTSSNSQPQSQAGHDRERGRESDLVTPAPSESHMEEPPGIGNGTDGYGHNNDSNDLMDSANRNGIGEGEEDIAMKMSGAMGEAYHTPLPMQQISFYNMAPEAFNLDFYVDDEDFGQYFAGFTGPGVVSGRDGDGSEGTGWDARGLDFLSRCL